jgi:hypothetical protein
MAAPSTTTVSPLLSAFDLPSNTRTLANAMGAARAAGARAEALPDPAANAPSVAAAPAMHEEEANFS